MLKLVRHANNSARAAPRNFKDAFGPELSSIEAFSTLLNQTSPSQLLALTDVRPMMSTYKELLKSPIDASPAQLAVRKVSKALQQTAADSSFALRSLPLAQRDPKQKTLFQQLTDSLNVVAESILSRSVVADEHTLTSILNAYETVNPAAGSLFFNELVEAQSKGELEFSGLPWGLYGIGAAVQCLLKSETPIEQIVEGVKRECGGDITAAPRWTLANLALAYLKCGRVKSAQNIFTLLMNEREMLSPKLVSFLLDAFIGDAPYEIALETFIEHQEHVPHHASMTRMLQHAFLREATLEDQISVFSNYLARLTLPNELQIKTVSSTLVANIVFSSPEASSNDILPVIKEVCEVYDRTMRQHTVLLNILLTEITSRWRKVDEARDLVLAVLQNYSSLDNGNVVSIRVRLNALSTLSHSASDIEKLWELRVSENMPKLSKLDWLALARGSRGSRVFLTKWTFAGRPYEADILRFCSALGFKNVV